MELNSTSPAPLGRRFGGAGAVALAGVGIARSLGNAVSFLGVIAVVFRWKRPVVTRATPPETLGGATRAAVRYVRYSPGVLRVLARAGMGMFFASALLALLPSLAHRISGSPIGYGVLLGGFGCGAVLGALAIGNGRVRAGRRMWWCRPGSPSSVYPQLPAACFTRSGCSPP